MNIHDTLSSIFPSGIIATGVPERDGFFEVLGLPKGVVPQNCERLASGESKPRVGQELRNCYLVRTADFLLFFRACPERTNRGHNAFVMSCGFAPRLEKSCQDLEAYALMCMKSQQ